VATITTTVASSTGASPGPTAAAGHHEAEVLGGEVGRPVLVAFGELEGAEEQQDGQEVEQQFHAGGAAMVDAIVPSERPLRFRARSRWRPN
jgi:hypothetical protein